MYSCIKLHLFNIYKMFWKHLFSHDKSNLNVFYGWNWSLNGIDRLIADLLLLAALSIEQILLNPSLKI